MLFCGPRLLLFGLLLYSTIILYDNNLGILNSSKDYRNKTECSVIIAIFYSYTCTASCTYEEQFEKCDNNQHLYYFNHNQICETYHILQILLCSQGNLVKFQLRTFIDLHHYKVLTNRNINSHWEYR